MSTLTADRTLTTYAREMTMQPNMAAVEVVAEAAAVAPVPVRALAPAQVADVPAAVRKIPTETQSVTKRFLDLS